MARPRKGSAPCLGSVQHNSEAIRSGRLRSRTRCRSLTALSSFRPGDLPHDRDCLGGRPGGFKPSISCRRAYLPLRSASETRSNAARKVCRAASSAPLSRQAGGWCSEALDQFEAGFDLADHVTEADRTLVSIGERVGCCSLVRHTGCPSPYALLGL